MTDFDSLDMDSGADESLNQKKTPKKSPKMSRSLAAVSQTIWITECKNMVQNLIMSLKCLDTPVSSLYTIFDNEFNIPNFY